LGLFIVAYCLKLILLGYNFQTLGGCLKLRYAAILALGVNIVKNKEFFSSNL